MLAVLVVGYFYTVIPVFQKEKLEEDVAKLELKQDKIVASSEAYQREINSLLATRKSLEDQNTKLRAERIALTDARDIAAKQSAVISSQLALERSKLNSTSRLYKQSSELIFEGTLGIQLVRPIFAGVTDADPFGGKSLDVAKNLKKEWTDPVADIQDVLNEAKQNQQTFGVPGGYAAVAPLLVNFEHQFEKNKAVFMVPTPDFNAWATSFQSQLAESRSHVQDCVNASFIKREKDEKWSSKEVAQLKRTDFWEKQSKVYQASCEVMADYVVESGFRAAWNAAQKVASDRIAYATEILLHGKKMPAVDVSLLRPPTISTERYADESKM